VSRRYPPPPNLLEKEEVTITCTASPPEQNRDTLKLLPRPALDGGDGKITFTKPCFDTKPALCLDTKPALCLDTKPALVLEPNSLDSSATCYSGCEDSRDSVEEIHTQTTPASVQGSQNSWGFMVPPHSPPPYKPVLPPDMKGNLIPPSMEEHETVNLLAPPQLKSGEQVTGQTKSQLRKENKSARVAKQEQQDHMPEWWSSHTGLFETPQVRDPIPEHLNQMVPRGLALSHPAAPLLEAYARLGCPTQTGKNWTIAQIQQAIDRGPHVSALEPEAIRQLHLEVAEKVKAGQARIVSWNAIRHNPPPELKISPVAMIPHKSRTFRAILDLSFPVRLSDGSTVPSVNECTIKTAPRGAIDQIGHSLQRIIHAFATADKDAKIFLAKWDIKDGFWRLNCESGQEWNFAYVLPEATTSDPKLVIPTSLQMGWIESPPYFCAASETARDVAEQYLQGQIDTLKDHKFLSLTMPDAHDLPATHPGPLRFLLEVFMDDFIGLAIPTSLAQLRHYSNAVMYGIHDIFPPHQDDSIDPISVHKLLKGDGRWATTKDILGLTFDGDSKTLWLQEDKRDALLTILSGWLRISRTKRIGIPFSEFQSVIAKIRHAFVTIPAGYGLMSPFNAILRQKPAHVLLHKNPSLTQALQECRIFLRGSVSAPTKCSALVHSWPDYIGITDASSFGAGGIIIGETKAIPPTVFRVQWPPDVTADIVSEANPHGRITNSDVEMAGLMLLWIAIEGVCPTLADTHVALFSDNSPTVSWVDRLATRSSAVALQFLRALALRLQQARTSPLTSLHIPGNQNAITDIPSRSFGSEPKWLCNSDDDLRSLFNRTFPLPLQASWNVYRIAPTLCTRVISILRMQVSTMDEWRRLPPRGNFGGRVGPPMSGLWDWTLIYRESSIHSKSVHSVVSPAAFERGTMAEEAKSQLRRSLARSRPLARRSPWPMATTPPKWPKPKTK
jgi:hypothetical protein